MKGKNLPLHSLCGEDVRGLDLDRKGLRAGDEEGVVPFVAG